MTRKKVVALKVVDVDPHDFKVHFLEKDESIQTVLHEIKILTQLRDSNAKNINLIIDAFPIHSQLWIVTEYCPGGSLHTLVSIPSPKATHGFRSGVHYPSSDTDKI